MIGPELGGLGLRTDRIYILESILQPDAATVLGYGHVMLTMTNGEFVSGLITAIPPPAGSTRRHPWRR